ncbi:MAG: hypothetical protein D4R70_02055 [Betaproteobacteria bacterium]|nr:MAG: hypothetical protein D4R70_02055 [Betaproteobacteria bacterium]
MPTANTEQTTSSPLPFGMEIGIAAIAWCLAWVIQLNLPALDYLPGVALIFLPAGARTLAVLVFGLRGALGIGIGSFITYYLWLFDAPDKSEYFILSGVLLALASAFSAYAMMRFVIHRYAIQTHLADLRYPHILLIVISQGLLSATLHQIIYHLGTVFSIYAALPLHETLFAWLSMAIGDIVGSMLLLYGVALVARAITYNRA